MYTLVDLHNIKKDTGEVFNTSSNMFQDYVDFCNLGNQPIVLKPDSYELVEGIYFGKLYYRLKISAVNLVNRKNLLVQNLYAQKGRVIEVLCKAVINYMTGKNDEELIDVNAMIATHGNILTLLSVNRHNEAKKLIDLIIPDAFINQGDIDYILSVYNEYTIKLDQISEQIVNAKL